MLWRRSAPTQTLPAPGPVPEARAIRQQALQASWKRDRRVASRRVALRWALWAARRYLLPAFAVVGAVVLVTLWVWQRWLAPAVAPVIAPAITTAPASTSAPAPPTLGAPRTVPESPDERPAIAPEPALQLRLQAEMPAPGPRAPPTNSAQPSADRFPPPKLTSDNWLHSKEP